MRVTIPCKKCGKECSRWRQCPDKSCSLDIAYCDTDGGDLFSIDEMVEHMVSAHGMEPPVKPRMKVLDEP